jgi:hypothetical protein
MLAAELETAELSSPQSPPERLLDVDRPGAH